MQPDSSLPPARHPMPLRFYREEGMVGWAGGDDGSKMFVFEVDMPHCGDGVFEDCTYNRPAVWALNAKVRASSLTHYP